MQIKNNIRSKLLFLLLTPLILIGAVSVTVCVSQFISYSNSEARHELYNNALTVTSVMDELYPGDYSISSEGALQKGNAIINGRVELLDVLKANTGFEYSIIYNGKRVSTTIKSRNSYIIGSSLNYDIWDDIHSERDYASTIIDINGEDYFACYIPLYDENNSTIGALGVAKSRDEVRGRQIKIILPIVGIISVMCLLSAFMILSYGKDMANCIEQIREFVNQIANEKFNKRLADDIYNREDELGDISRDITIMRNTLRDMIELDGLTQLYNKRTGNRKFEGLKNKCIANDRPFCLGMGDIDFFKKVNDTYGHDAGDEVLKTIASIIKRHIKHNGFVARWGGEEFMIGFENKSISEAKSILESTLNEIRETIVHYDEDDIKVTMTFGIVAGRKNMSSEDLFKAADNRLYVGKECGRNRIVIKDS